MMKLSLKRNVKDFLITVEKKPRSFTTGHCVIHLQRGLHLAYLISEHTVDFVAHGFVAGCAEMGCDLVGCLSDSLYKVGLSSYVGANRLVYGHFVIHRVFLSGA
jgi:hypothetical protein